MKHFLQRLSIFCLVFIQGSDFIHAANERRGYVFPQRTTHRSGSRSLQRNYRRSMPARRSRAQHKRVARAKVPTHARKSLRIRSSQRRRWPVRSAHRPATPIAKPRVAPQVLPPRAAVLQPASGALPASSAPNTSLAARTLPEPLAAQSFILLTTVDRTAALDSLRLAVGKRVKGIITTLVHDTHLSHKARAELARAKIMPVQQLHITQLDIGVIPLDKRSCVEQTIGEQLNHLSCKNDWFHVTIPSNPTYALFGSFIALPLAGAISSAWYAVPASLNAALAKRCGIHSKTFSTYGVWHPHLSLFKITVETPEIFKEKTASGKTVKEVIEQALNAQPFDNGMHSLASFNLKKVYLRAASKNVASTLFAFNDHTKRWALTHE